LKNMLKNIVRFVRGMVKNENQFGDFKNIIKRT